jgi:hypothetical protein
MTPAQPRRPPGTPRGGQFAPTSRPEAHGIELTESATGNELAEARAVLLRGLRALGPQRQALTLVGAQAVYEHTRHLRNVQPTLTTDGDTCLTPGLVDPSVDIGEAMLGAGFTSHPDRPGIWGIDVDGRRVAFDILVPEALAGPGRRGARVPGQSKRYIGRAAGLELAVSDRSIHIVEPLDGLGEAQDVYVAGPGALMCAKAYKLMERIGERDRGGRDRVKPKDAGDVWRLMAVSDPATVSAVFAGAERDATIGEAVALGRRYLTDLFGMGGLGLRLATVDLEDDLSEKEIAQVVSSWMEAFRAGA